MTSLLVAEDDDAIAEPLVRVLRREGYEVELVEDGNAAWEAAAGGRFDMVLLDLGLPGIDGIEVCRRLRSAGTKTRVLMLTARADEVDKVVGLDAGADDYVTKPFGLAELLARVRALVRRSSPDAINVQGLRVDVAARRAWVEDAELDLTMKEFDLLALLAEEAGNVVSRERIMEEVWDTNWYGSTKTLDMHISSLRRKLDDASEVTSGRPRIATVRGVGYRMEATPEMEPPTA